MYICPSLASNTHCRVRKGLVALHVTMKSLPWQNVVSNEIHRTIQFIHVDCTCHHEKQFKM